MEEFFVTVLKFKGSAILWSFDTLNVCVCVYVLSTRTAFYGATTAKERNKQRERENKKVDFLRKFIRQHQL